MSKELGMNVVGDAALDGKAENTGKFIILLPILL